MVGKIHSMDFAVKMELRHAVTNDDIVICDSISSCRFNMQIRGKAVYNGGKPRLPGMTAINHCVLPIFSWADMVVSS